MPNARIKTRALRVAAGAILCAAFALPHSAQAAPEKAKSAAVTSASNLRAAPARLRTPFDDYIARPEPLYGWRKVPPQDTGVSDDMMETLARNLGGNVTQQALELTSQQWQGTTWTHRVTIFRPTKNLFPDTAIIYATGGETMSLVDIAMGNMLANATGATFVNLLGIPKQPLWGLKEDGLISYTFEQYMKTGDATWPLLFPMAKSVVKTMDAVTAYSQREGTTPIRRFVIMGASKRGWTTWLAGAADKRVIGIAPIVYDNLNLQKQMPRQLETWGDYSVMIKDYTERGLQQQLATPRGQKLGAMVDPWTYRDRLTIPKLIINGTNDPYWTLGALNVYQSDLRGPTNILYVPNGGHDLGGLQGAQFAMQNMAGWFRRVAAGKAVPTVEMLDQTVSAEIPKPVSVSNTDSPTITINNIPPLQNNARNFTVKTNAVKLGETVRGAKLWVARSATRDFRKSKWVSMPLTHRMNGNFTTEVPLVTADDQMKYTAAFAEIELAPNAWSPQATSLSTAIKEWKERD